MYVRLGRITATPGKQRVLADRMLEAAEGLRGVRGCRQYFVFLGEGDDVWISEFWDSKEDHDASLELPGTREFIAATMPLIANFETVPVIPHGGIGP